MFIGLDTRMTLFRWLHLLMWLGCTAMASAQNVIHHGPTVEVQVQRGDVVLPISLVNKLHAGDRLLVRPDSSTLTKDGWVLLLARVSLTGNQVESKHFEVSDLKAPAELEITAENQVAVIMLAPQLRNLFGLYTSLSESASLLNDVLRADPQRFYELQKVDQINQAIQAISQGLTKRMAGARPQEAVQAARDLAAKFGVRTIDADCLRNEVVNTECVATQIVINKDFSLPSSSDLSAMVGNKKAVDFNSFLLSNVRMFSEASDFLSNKYRDSYDFAPTFGRRQATSNRIDLYSIARFRKGNVKTAYIYVPSWFNGNMPVLQTQEKTSSCFNRGELQLQITGKLPLLSYWHDWQMKVSDPLQNLDLGAATGISFDPDSARLSFDALTFDEPAYPASNEVLVNLSARFGFDYIKLKPVRMRLPTKEPSAFMQALDGTQDLIAGEETELALRDAALTACVQRMELELPDGKKLHTEAANPTRLAVDLRKFSAASLNLVIHQVGVSALTLPLRILPAKARVTRIEHAQSDQFVTVYGTQLDRISRIEIGRASCAVNATAPGKTGESTLVLACAGDVSDNSNLPDKAMVVHHNEEPRAVRVPLTKIATKPRVSISSSSKNAVVVSPSAKALQWNLSPSDAYFSEDSGLNLLLQAQAPYSLVRGSYVLQLRFQDDPQTDSHPISTSLIADFAHNELRTRSPVTFAQSELPSVVNPLEYRIVHNPSGLASDWQSLGRQVILLPDFQGAMCAPEGQALWLNGKRLDLIDAVLTGVDSAAQFEPVKLVSCPKGLCLSLPNTVRDSSVQIRMRWIDDHVFNVRLPQPSKTCEAAH